MDHFLKLLGVIREQTIEIKPACPLFNNLTEADLDKIQSDVEAKMNATIQR